MLNRAPNVRLSTGRLLSKLWPRSLGAEPAVGKPAQAGTLASCSAPDLQTRLNIPVMRQTADDLACRAAQMRGQFLARQDRWEDLAREVRTADQARSTTPGGMAMAELLAFGARSDVVHAVEHALCEGQAGESAALIDGIAALENMRRETGFLPELTTIVALTHIDIGWAWRGTGRGATVPRAARDKCSAHFDRAAELLTPLCKATPQSPLLAVARCALLPGNRDPHLRVADVYEHLIDLDPHNPRHMRTLGNHLLPRWFGSYAQLELEARRTAARTHKIWGAGAYTWVCFDAIATDDAACALVDVDFFIDGLHDIVAARPDQETINLLAAYCAVAMRQGEGLNADADLPRLQIADCAGWLIRDHLTELHPLIWAHATDGFDNNAQVTSLKRFAARGHASAMQVIADLFRDEIAGGQSVTFTPHGPRVDPI